MTQEQLLKPRYKVIADYPASPYTNGDIIEPGVSLYYGPSKEWLEAYPHLFKKLEWWEERTPEEMPNFLKNTKHGHIIKVDKWSGFNINNVPLFEFRISMKHPESIGVATEWLPATKEGYNSLASQPQRKGEGEKG